MGMNKNTFGIWDNMNNLKYRILYGICFFSLMLIDWSRGSQRGVVWEMTVNFTGVVVAVILLSMTEIKRFKHVIYLAWSLLGAVSIPISLWWWQNHQTLIYRDKLWSAVLSVWMLGYLAIYEWRYWGIKRWLRCLVDKKSNIVLYAMLFWMFFSLNEDIWPIWYLFMALLFVGMPRTEIKQAMLEKGLVDGIIAGFFVLQGLAFVFRPYDMLDKRYVGMYANANMNALFYCIVTMALLVRLFEIHRDGAAKRQKDVLTLLLTGVCAFQLLTVSRTGVMTTAILLLVYVILVLFIIRKRTAGYALLSIAGFAVAVIIMVPVTYSVARYIPPLFHHPIWYDGEYSEDKVHSWDPIDSEKYVTFDEVLNQFHIRTGGLYIRSYALELFIDEGEEVTSYQPGGITVLGKYYEYGSPELLQHETLYGRLGIWEHYLKNGTLLGHSNSWGHRTGMAGITWHGQNAFVQFWFYYGIPSAMLYLIWILYGLIDGCKWVREGRSAGMIMLLSMLIAFVFGLFEATWYPAQMILFLMIFAQIIYGYDRREICK